MSRRRPDWHPDLSDSLDVPPSYSDIASGQVADPSIAELLGAADAAALARNDAPEQFTKMLAAWRRSATETGWTLGQIAEVERYFHSTRQTRYAVERVLNAMETAE